MANPGPLVTFLLLWIACLRLHRTHAILGRARRASRERRLLELRILHERLKRAPVSSVVQHAAITLAAQNLSYTCIVQNSRLSAHVRMADPVLSGFKPPHEVDWPNVHSIRIGSMCIQCGRNQCALNAH